MRKGLLWAALLVLASTGQASAQAWDAPTFFSPRQHDDLGVYVIFPDGGDVGVEGIWRQSGNLNLGVRLGVVDERVLLGAEFYNPIRLSQSPVLLSWLLGFGATFGDNVTWLRVPFGVSLGANLGNPGGIHVTPYVHPRVALDVVAFDVGDEEQTDTDVNFDVDLGADVLLSPAWTLKVGATVGESDAFGVGLAYRLQRRVVVR